MVLVQAQQPIDRLLFKLPRQITLKYERENYLCELIITKTYSGWRISYLHSDMEMIGVEAGNLLQAATRAIERLKKSDVV